MRHRNLIGDKYGRLTVVSYAPKQGRHYVFNCICECGNATSAQSSNLIRGLTKSCGCIHRETVSRSSRTHAKSGSKTYRIWSNMKARCTNPKSKSYKNYGGRGITVCKRWLSSFENFYSDMGECPNKHSIERIDVNGNYEPKNCRWATNKEQANNRRNNDVIEVEGATRTFKAHCDHYGIKYKTAFRRYKYLGWSIKRTLEITTEEEKAA